MKRKYLIVSRMDKLEGLGFLDCMNVDKKELYRKNISLSDIKKIYHKLDARNHILSEAHKLKDYDFLHKLNIRLCDDDTDNEYDGKEEEEEDKLFLDREWYFFRTATEQQLLDYKKKKGELWAHYQLSKNMNISEDFVKNTKKIKWFYGDLVENGIVSIDFLMEKKKLQPWAIMHPDFDQKTIEKYGILVNYGTQKRVRDVKNYTLYKKIKIADVVSVLENYLCHDLIGLIVDIL